MTRNGLLALVAVLMALALNICAEFDQMLPFSVMNSALGQVTYYDRTQPEIDPDDPFPPAPGGVVLRELGPAVFLEGTGVNTRIASTPGIADPDAIGKPTASQIGWLSTDGIVFSTGMGAQINAVSLGAEISTYSTSPAIRNGNNTITTETVFRLYVIQVETMSDGEGPQILRVGFRYSSDPIGTFRSLADGALLSQINANSPWDAMPENYQDYELNIPGLEDPVPLFIEPSTSATIPTPVVLNLPDGTYDMGIQFWFTVPQAVGPPLPIGSLAGSSSGGLPSTETVTGEYTAGMLTINARPVGAPTFVGEERTLIYSAGGNAIENHGILTVFDSIINGATTGIFSEYARGYTVDGDGLITTYGPTSPYDIRLFNTQIGRPGGITEVEWIVDPETGEIIYITEIFNGIKIYDTNGQGEQSIGMPGAPEPTYTFIQEGQKIISDGVNGRIIAGNDVEMRRYPIGSTDYFFNRTFTDSLAYSLPGTVLNIWALDFTGPAIGIHVQARPFGTMENVYMNSGRYVGTTTPSGALDQSWISNRVELRDNSWVFATTGISFGNTDSTPPTSGSGVESIRITIDPTSGIFASDTGITDRYSTLQLYAIVNDDVYGSLGAFSGSMHEIQVDGKVIAGIAPRSGVRFNFPNTVEMSSIDRNMLSNVYYVDAGDPDSDQWGRVYFNADTAHKFIAYDDQPNRVFWFLAANGGRVPLTQYDYATQRWMVHPDAPGALIQNGPQSSNVLQDFFYAFDTLYDYGRGVGIHITGVSQAWEGEVLPPGLSPWSSYYGPTVRQITALGDDALIAGGFAAMMFENRSHVANVQIGKNKDVENLSSMLYAPNNTRRTAQNFQAFDMMSVADRAKLLYDPKLLYDNDGTKFHFDNAGVHGDILSAYNGVVGVLTGTDGEYSPTGVGFGVHTPSPPPHPGPLWYHEEILELETTSSPSYLLGFRNGLGPGFFGSDIVGRSVILDEHLLWYLSTASAAPSSYGYADTTQHFREGLAHLLHQGAPGGTGLSTAELLAGYTHDGTLIEFFGGDIYSGNIYGGGYGAGQGNIDVRFKEGTTILNRNVIENVNSATITQTPGIRVRDLYVEKTGHLMLNDSWIAINPFTGVDVDRVMIHDFLNEGIVSGNGLIQIAQRSGSVLDSATNTSWGVSYFAGYFINWGILAPGLPGLIGANEWQAYELDKTAYSDMLNKVSGSPNDAHVPQGMQCVPGGQYGTIVYFGHLRLMDEIDRPNFTDPATFNTMEKLPHGEYHVTIGKDTIGGMFGKYGATIAGAKSTYDPITHTYNTSVVPEGEISKESWQTIAAEKLGVHLSWFSPTAFVDSATRLPLLSLYEQFEYLNDTKRRKELQRKMVEMVLTPSELHAYDNNPAERARLNQRLQNENNIRFELTDLDRLLWRYGFSDVVSVHGTIPSYRHVHGGWTGLTDYGDIPADYLHSPNNAGNLLLGTTQLGGRVQADLIFDLDSDARSKETLTSYIIIASEGYTYDSSVKTIGSSTNDWVFANVDVLPILMPSGQSPAVLTVIDDPHYYRNRVRQAGAKHNAQSVANALDKAMQTNPGLALSLQFGLNSPEMLNSTLRQMANPTRANSVMMNVTSPSDHLFNRIGYGVGGMSTGARADVVFRNNRTGKLHQPYGQPGVPMPEQQFAPPPAMATGPGGQYRGQNPNYRTASIWGAYTHSTTFKDGDQNSYKYTAHRNGVMFGNEWNLTPSSVIGGVAMINNTKLNSRGDEVKSDDYTFGVYLVAAPYEQFELRSFIGGGYQTYKGDRYLQSNSVFITGGATGVSYGQSDIFGINDHYEWDTKGSSFNYSLELARPFALYQNFIFRPVLGFEYQNIRQKAYSERKGTGSRISWSNNGLNMAENMETQGDTTGTYGMDYRAMTFARTLVRFGYNTESYFSRGGFQMRKYYVVPITGDRYPTSAQSFTSGSEVFNVRGANMRYHYSQLGFGTHVWLNQDRTATLFVDGDWNFSWNQGTYNVFNVSGGLQINW